MSWRPVTVTNTDADTDGVKYIDVPERREYRIYGVSVDYAKSSDITYDADPTPLMDIVTSSDSHYGKETVLMRISPLVTIGDTDGYTAHYHSAPAVGSDGSPLTLPGVAFVDIPGELVLSTMHRLKFHGTPSTGGTFIQDIAGLFGIRDNYGRRA